MEGLDSRTKWVTVISCRKFLTLLFIVLLCVYNIYDHLTTLFSFCPPCHRVPHSLGSIFMLLFVFGLVRLKDEKETVEFRIVELRIVELENEDTKKTTLEETYLRRPRFAI